MSARLIPLLAAAFVLLALPLSPVAAEDTASLERSSALIGEHVQLRLRVLAPPGATVELAPGTPSWNGVELVSVDDVQQVTQPAGALWLIDATVAPFSIGELDFAPAVIVSSGADSVVRLLPALRFTVKPTLGPEDPLELSPLAPPRSIAGAESPWLRPGIVAGVSFAGFVLVLLAWLLARALGRRLRRGEPSFEPDIAPPTLAGAEELIDSDPVAAYRAMSAVVKSELARRHGLRATALTTAELGKRLEVAADRWEARLVTGLLEECDSVIYAGYRPAAERRQADLTMARQIVGVAS